MGCETCPGVPAPRPLRPPLCPVFAADGHQWPWNLGFLRTPEGIPGVPHAQGPCPLAGQLCLGVLGDPWCPTPLSGQQCPCTLSSLGVPMSHPGPTCPGSLCPYSSCAWGPLVPRVIDIVTNEVREQSRLSVGSYRYKNPTLGLPKTFWFPLEDHTKRKAPRWLIWLHPEK